MTGAGADKVGVDDFFFRFFLPSPLPIVRNDLLVQHVLPCMSWFVLAIILSDV